MSSVIVECHYCNARVQGTIKGDHQYEDAGGFPTRVVLVGCPTCLSPLLVQQDLVQVGREEHDWIGSARVWPEPTPILAWTIPPTVRSSLDEAGKCFRGTAYNACATMCGTTLEAICRHFIEADTSSTSKAKRMPMLSEGLKLLLSTGVIDQRLFKWSQTLQAQRNIGVHPSGENIPREDAKDLLDFAYAITEYVFVLSDKYESFVKRVESRAHVLDQGVVVVR